MCPFDCSLWYITVVYYLNIKSPYLPPLSQSSRQLANFVSNLGSLFVDEVNALFTSRDGRFGSKVGQIGPQMWLQSGLDWPQLGQIRDFFRSDFSTFGSYEPNVLISYLKKSRMYPISSPSDPLWALILTPLSYLRRQNRDTPVNIDVYRSMRLFSFIQNKAAHKTLIPDLQFLFHILWSFVGSIINILAYTITKVPVR